MVQAVSPCLARYTTGSASLMNGSLPLLRCSDAAECYGVAQARAPESADRRSEDNGFVRQSPPLAMSGGAPFDPDSSLPPLVDRAAVRYLASVEMAGTEIVNCPEYVRSWIAAENESW